MPGCGQKIKKRKMSTFVHICPHRSANTTKKQQKATNIISISKAVKKKNISAQMLRE
jgi:hypothetical protein